MALIATKLTKRQSAFVTEYLVDLNAKQAAIRAGYSKRTAKQIGFENLTKPYLVEAVLAAIGERAKRTEFDQDWVIEMLVENVRRSMTQIPVLDIDGKETGEWRYQGTVANRSLELLGKHLGMFPNRHELSGPGGEPIKNVSLNVDANLSEILKDPEVRAAAGAVARALEGRPGSDGRTPK